MSFLYEKMFANTPGLGVTRLLDRVSSNGEII